MAEATQSSQVIHPNLQLTAAVFPEAALSRERHPPTLREEGGEALALSGITHDARNLVTALGLCAELISQPGVLGAKHGHFSAEIRSIATSSAQLVKRLTELCRKTAQAKEQAVPEAPVADLAESVGKMQSLLTAIAGPGTDVQFGCLPSGGHVRLTEESLSRILVNLVRNAADAMPNGGRIRITTQRGGGASFLWTVDGDVGGGSEYLWDDAPHTGNQGSGTVVLTVEDNGPGIPTEFLERVFDAGFSTRAGGRSWPESQHHGLGLSIVRQLVEAAGGTVRATNGSLDGARFEIELPLTNVTPPLLSDGTVHGPGTHQ
ncbi:MAG TPA: HAMP domain-containing sensor histidine kinase [Acidobacteriaceae bacterium]|jgi:signal transduction histidine kinase